MFVIVNLLISVSCLCFREAGAADQEGKWHRAVKLEEYASSVYCTIKSKVSRKGFCSTGDLDLIAGFHFSYIRRPQIPLSWTLVPFLLTNSDAFGAMGALSATSMFAKDPTFPSPMKASVFFAKFMAADASM